MADLGFLEGEIKALPEAMRASMLRIVRHLAKEMRYGHPNGDQPDPALNFGGAFFHGTTPDTPGDEFTIAHGFGRTPYLALPILVLDTVGSELVPLTVSRAADDKRLYFTSTEAGAHFSLFVEG